MCACLCLCKCVCLLDKPERAKRLWNRWGRRGSCPLHEGSLPMENSPPSAVWRPVKVCAVLTMVSLYLWIRGTKQTCMRPFLTRLSRDRVQLAGQCTVLQRVVDEMSAQEMTSSRTDEAPSQPPISHLPSPLCSTQTLIGHGRRVKRTNFHRHLTTKGRWEERR